MAQPIAETPTLRGEDAKRFVRKMFEPPTKEEIAFSKKIQKKFKDHNPLLDDIE